WTDEMQAHQDQLVERQNVLMQAWEQFMQDASSDADTFTTDWMAARATALTDAGFEPIFE
ncbi:MAG TPA: C4-dicarboxylate ABC transporter substrate-binding protein, partial [Halomonas sp.]|nr:C4-dicarboxylate ABC transporter substrate-binding protein [Halomonas sp.]